MSHTFMGKLLKKLHSAAAKDLNWDIEVITHGGQKVMDWLINIYLVAYEIDAETIHEIHNMYNYQRYVSKTLADESEQYVKLKIWGKDGDKSLGDSIPFQYCLIQIYEDETDERRATEQDKGIDAEADITTTINKEIILRNHKIFFINSGDLFYSVMLKGKRGIYSMSTLSRFTKGYVNEQQDILQICDDIFKDISEKSQAMNDPSNDVIHVNFSIEEISELIKKVSENNGV